MVKPSTVLPKQAPRRYIDATRAYRVIAVLSLILFLGFLVFSCLEILTWGTLKMGREPSRDRGPERLIKIWLW